MKAGVVSKRDAGLASGAQLLSTDYPFDWKADGAGYHVEFDKGVARCNVVVKAAGCSFDLLEESGKARWRPLPAIDLGMKTGPEVGARMPAFRLQDQKGDWRELTDLRGAKGTMLVVVRSTDW